MNKRGIDMGDLLLGYNWSTNTLVCGLGVAFLFLGELLDLFLRDWSKNRLDGVECKEG